MSGSEAVANRLDRPAMRQVECRTVAGLYVEPNGITAGIDVQRDRVEIIVRALGRDDESWLVYWGEIYGNTIDKSDPVWPASEKLIFEPRRHAAVPRPTACDGAQGA